MPDPIFEGAGILGERIRARRNELHWWLVNLEARTGVHWSYLGQVERGLRNPSLRNVLRIAEGLEIDPAELVRGLPAPPPDEEDEAGQQRRPRRG